MKNSNLPPRKTRITHKGARNVRKEKSTPPPQSQSNHGRGKQSLRKMQQDNAVKANGVFSKSMEDLSIEELLAIAEDPGEGTYIKEEKNVAELLVAAYNSGILSELTLDEQDPAYFLCKIQNEPYQYRVYFGKAPDTVRNYVHAERALNASDLVIRLTECITSRFSFYAEAKEITAPTPEVLQDIVSKSLNLDKQSVTFSYKQDKDGSNERFKTSYEVELLIEATVDYLDEQGRPVYAYERIIDNITAEMSADKKISYKYKKPEKLSQKVVGADKVNSVKELIDAHKEEIQRIARTLLLKLSKPREKLKILNILSADKQNSVFKNDFLEKLETKNGVQVGQINVNPSTVYVASVQEKIFSYNFSMNGKSLFPFFIAWNSNSSLSNETPLYVVMEKGKAVGLTYEMEQGSVKRPQLGVDCDLVLVYTLSKDKKLLPAALSIVTKGERKSELDVLYPESERFAEIDGVSFGSPAEKVAYTKAYYTLDSVIKIDGGTYLKADCEDCPFTKESHWSGKMSKDERYYINNENRLVRGRIYTGAMVDAHLQRCKTCGQEFYAFNRVYRAYKNAHMQIDGTPYCEVCEKTIFERKGKLYTLQTVYLPNEEKSDSKPLFVETDKEDSALDSHYIGDGKLCKLEADSPILDRLYDLNNGAVKKCGHCGKLLYLYGNTAQACETCETVLGDKCKALIHKNDYTFTFITSVESTKKHWCKSCKQTLDRQNSEWEIIENVYVPQMYNPQKVLEKRKGVSNLVYACAVCNTPLYQPDWERKHYEHCELCDRPYHEECGNALRAFGKYSFDKKVCPKCEKVIRTEKKTDPSTKKEYSFTEAFDAFETLKNDNFYETIALENAVEQKVTEANAYITQNFEQCLAHMDTDTAKEFVKYKKHQGSYLDDYEIDIIESEIASDGTFFCVFEVGYYSWQKYRFLYTKKGDKENIVPYVV